MDRPDHRLPRTRRVRKGKDFDAVFREGRSSHGRLMTVFARRRDGEPADSEPRLGISAPRRLGGAVVRNRVKRLVREAFRLNWQALPRGCDLVIVPRGDWADVSLESVIEELPALAARAAEKASRKNEG